MVLLRNICILVSILFFSGVPYIVLIICHAFTIESAPECLVSISC